jgi:hypothetical protein
MAINWLFSVGNANSVFSQGRVYDSSSYFWFWHFIRNLNLYDYNDSVDYDEYEVMDILNRFIAREYEPEGYGGILPIPESHRDQANVELWYQFCQYISEVEFDDYNM